MAPHGTLTRYKRYRCRCSECRTANTIYNRRWTARNRSRIRALRNAARCPECGGAMSCGNGVANDPKRCLACEKKRMAANRLPCGTRASYVRGCRCRPCTDAAVAYARRYRKVAA